MTRRRLSLGLGAMALVAAMTGATIIVTGPLNADELEPQPAEHSGGRFDEYSSPLVSPNGQALATAHTEIRPREGGYTVVFSLEHTPDTGVDSLDLTLQAHDTQTLMPSVALEVPNASFPPVSFEELPGANGAELNIDSLGIHGESTVTLFLLIPGEEELDQVPDEIDLRYSFDMHEEAVLGARYHGEGHMVVNLG